MNNNNLSLALELEKEVGRAIDGMMPRLLELSKSVCPLLREQYLEGLIFKREFMNGVIEGLANPDILYDYYLQCQNPDR